jgi:hypothetical protein
MSSVLSCEHGTEPPRFITRGEFTSLGFNASNRAALSSVFAIVDSALKRLH